MAERYRATIDVHLFRIELELPRHGNAAAPSFVPGALPAVTVPSFLNAGLSFASASMLVSSRGDSSYLMTIGSPFFCGTSTGRICASKKQDLRARTAF